MSVSIGGGYGELFRRPPSQRRALRALRRVHESICRSLPQGIDETGPGVVYAPGPTLAERSPSAGERREGGGLDLGARSPAPTFAAGPVVAPATEPPVSRPSGSLS